MMADVGEQVRAYVEVAFESVVPVETPFALVVRRSARTTWRWHALAAAALAVVVAVASWLVLRDGTRPSQVRVGQVPPFTLVTDWSRTLAQADVPGAPTVAGRLVLVATTNAALGNASTVEAFDAMSGRRRWSDRLAPVSGAPVVAGDLALVRLRDGGVVAIRPSDGKVRWRAATVSSGDFPASLLVDRSTVYIGSQNGELEAIDSRTGALRWRRTLDAAVLAPPAVRDGSLYVGTAPVPLGSGGGSLYALDEATGQQQWRSAAQLNGPVLSQPVAGDQVVAAIGRQFSATGNESLLVLDRIHGTSAWQVTPGGKLSDPVVTAGVVAVTSSGGVLEAFPQRLAAPPSGASDPSPTPASPPQPTWRLEIGPALSPQAIMQHGALIATGDGVTAVDPNSGAPRWRVAIPNPYLYLTSPAASGLLAVVNSQRGELSVIDPTTGQVLASEPKRSVPNQLTVRGSHLYRIDLHGGTPLGNSDSATITASTTRRR